MTLVHWETDEVVVIVLLHCSFRMILMAVIGVPKFCKLDALQRQDRHAVLKRRHPDPTGGPI